MVSKERIRGWLEEGLLLGAAHVLVFEGLSWPEYVYDYEDPKEIMENKMALNSELRILEVYNLKMDIEYQLLEKRAWHIG